MVERKPEVASNIRYLRRPRLLFEPPPGTSVMEEGILAEDGYQEVPPLTRGIQMLRERIPQYRQDHESGVQSVNRQLDKIINLGDWRRKRRKFDEIVLINDRSRREEEIAFCDELLVQINQGNIEGVVGYLEARISKNALTIDSGKNLPSEGALSELEESNKKDLVILHLLSHESASAFDVLN